MQKERLTEDDLDYLFSDFDQYFPQFLNEEFRTMMINNVKLPLKKEFETCKVYKDILPKLKDEIEKRLRQSIIPAGEMVGVICAQSIGERQTQLTLNSFHQAGLSVGMVVTGVPRFMEILNATKEPKVTKNTFCLQNKDWNSVDMIRKNIGYSLKYLNWSNLIESELFFHHKEDEPWFETFQHFYPLSSDIQRNMGFTFKLNKKIMYQYRIPMYLIKERIEEEFEDVYVIFSPLSICQVDLFINLEKLKQIYETEFKNIERNLLPNRSDEYFLELFMFEVFRPKLFDVSICGIRGVKDFYIQKELGTSKYFVETEGTNFLEVLKLPYLDQSSLRTNHMWDVYEICGIEGVRKFLFEELKSIVSSDGTFINPCHLNLLIDLMTFNGVIQSISRYGVKKEQNSVLTKSSFEESLEHFSKAGFFCENEPVKSVSASIMCGKRSNIGSGLCTLKMDWTHL